MDKNIIPAKARCYAVIDLSAIDKNLFELSGKIPEGCLKMAVVKGNAYGHGALTVAAHIEDRIDYFGVATADEARKLRSGGIVKPILVLSYVMPEDYPDMVKLGISLTVSEILEARELSRVAAGAGKRVKIHIPVDTGMGRIGVFPDEEGADRIARIASMSHLDLEGVFSHYSLADSEDKTVSREQNKIFCGFLGRLAARGINPPLSHISNSAAAMELDSYYGMCRLGIAIYGFYPSVECDREKTRLTPAMSWYSRVIQVKRVPRGYKIGYGQKYEAPSERLVATVSVGYGDGYPRGLGCLGEVLVRGVRAPILGKVCMDMIMIDVTDVGDVTVGERVTLLGADGDEYISAEEIASLANSFHYEIICRPTERVPRFYIREE